MLIIAKIFISILVILLISLVIYFGFIVFKDIWLSGKISEKDKSIYEIIAIARAKIPVHTGKSVGNGTITIANREGGI